MAERAFSGAGFPFGDPAIRTHAEIKMILVTGLPAVALLTTAATKVLLCLSGRRFGIGIASGGSAWRIYGRAPFSRPDDETVLKIVATKGAVLEFVACWVTEFAALPTLTGPRLMYFTVDHMGTGLRGPIN